MRQIVEWGQKVPAAALAGNASPWHWPRELRVAREKAFARVLRRWPDARIAEAHYECELRDGMWHYYARLAVEENSSPVARMIAARR